MGRDGEEPAEMDPRHHEAVKMKVAAVAVCSEWAAFRTVPLVLVAVDTAARALVDPSSTSTISTANRRSRSRSVDLTLRPLSYAGCFPALHIPAAAPDDRSRKARYAPMPLCAISCVGGEFLLIPVHTLGSSEGTVD